MKKTSIVLTTMFLISIITSCFKYDCGDFTQPEGRITELSASIGTYTNSPPYFSPSKSTNFNQAAMQITIAEVDYSEISEATRITKFSFLNVAYACDPVPKPTQSIGSIVIMSESPVYSNGKEFPKGENLNELFKISSYSHIKEELSISEFIEKQNEDLWLFGSAGESIVFQLKDQPDSLINQAFTFDFSFSDSVKIKVETPVFEVGN